MTRARAVMAALACAATTLMVGAGVSDATSSPAVTGAASSVTGTAAQLNGTINPGGLDSFWSFQYGTSAATYGHTTPVLGPLSGTAPVRVATLIKDLQPGTTYHFRLVAIRGQAGTSGDATGYTGGDASFTTAAAAAGTGAGASAAASAHARASLRGRTLAVHRGAATMSWACSGTTGATCKGRVSLWARHTAAGRPGLVSCGAASFRVPAGARRSVRAALGKSCLALVRSARGHRLRASAVAAFTAGTGTRSVSVTLALG